MAREKRAPPPEVFLFQCRIAEALQSGEASGFPEMLLLNRPLLRTPLKQLSSVKLNRTREFAPPNGFIEFDNVHRCPFQIQGHGPIVDA